MKISIDNDIATSVAWHNGQANSHWRVNYDDGVVEHGSSGSPLFDYNHKIIGQLHGNQNYNHSLTYCEQPIGEYGRFDVSWNNGLAPFLDPNNTGAITINTIKKPYISGPSNICSQGTFSIKNASDLPPYTRYEWTHSSNLTYVSGQNTTQYKVNAPNYSSDAWVQAKILYPVGNVTPFGVPSATDTIFLDGHYDTIPLPKKYFTIGLGATTGNEISDCPPLEGFFYELGLYAFSFTPSSGNSSIITGYQWNVSGGTIIHGNENSEMIQVKVDKLSNGNDMLQVSVDITTSCGNTEYYYCYAPIHSATLKTSKLTITPNPTSENVTITLSNEKEERLTKTYDIVIVDIANNIKYHNNIRDQVTLQVSDWQPGLYTVKVSHEGEVLQGKFIVK